MYFVVDFLLILGLFFLGSGQGLFKPLTISALKAFARFFPKCSHKSNIVYFDFSSQNVRLLSIEYVLGLMRRVKVKEH